MQAQAQKDMATLSEFAQDARHNPEIRALAANATATLRAGLETAKQYDQLAAEISAQLTSSDLQTVSSLLNRIGKLPEPSLVLATAESPAKIRSAVLTRLAELVEADCKKFENLQKLTQVEHYLAQLKGRRQIVAKLSIAPLLERIDRAMELVNFQAAQLASEEREEEVRVAIRAMDVASGLCKLQEFRSQLEAISGRSEATMKLRDERLKAVNQQITHLENKVTEWKGQLDAVTSLAGLKSENDRILRMAHRYDDTEYAVSVTQTLQRIDLLQQYLLELAVVQNSSDGNLRNPGDVQQMLWKAAELRAKYSEQLSAMQIHELDNAVAKIEGDAKVKTARALVWLRDRQAEYITTTDPIALKGHLQQTPSFLPDEARSDLAMLIRDVQRKIDADIVMSIEQKFLEIADLDQRRRCLLRLEQLLQPVTYTQAKVDGHR
jgi:hypothetical protein